MKETATTLKKSTFATILQHLARIMGLSTRKGQILMIVETKGLKK